MLAVLCLFIALILFVAATFRTWGRVNLIALGLAFVVLASLIGHVTVG